MSKCNKLSGGFQRCLEIKTLHRSTVDGVFDLLNVGSGQFTEISALGQVPADQAVDMLVGSALPGAVGIAEVTADTDHTGDSFVSEMLEAIV